MIVNGMSYIFHRVISDDEQRAETTAMTARGNHKSAQTDADVVAKLLAKDVTHGFSIPLPVSIIPLIPHAGVQPLGLVSQWTIDEKGNRVKKFRITQDLTFSSEKGIASKSINSRINMTAYAEMVYGWCFPRILHFISALRAKYPGIVIFIAKYDYSDAYRRIAHNASAAVQTIAILPPLAYLALRLTFGGAPNPPAFTLFSEVVTDLANEISQCDEWDPIAVHSPAQPTVPDPIRLPPSVPMAEALPMAVSIPIGKKTDARVDGFIDDLINVFLDTSENCARQPQVVPLAMHVTSRPHAGDDKEPIPRRTLLSMPKLASEGRPEEVQTVLGWTIDTRRLLVALPHDKFTAWTADIDAMTSAKRCTFETLERLIGRLNHASYVMPICRHFLSRLRDRLKPRPKYPKKYLIGLSPAEAGDLELWKRILSKANQGVSINLLVTREPNRICWSDACPYGIGGYSLSGRAWRIRMPKNSPIWGHEGINNLLEFIGMAINIWLECLDDSGAGNNCILAIGDNTSAIGWLHNTSHLDPAWRAHDVHLVVARHVADLLITYNCCLATQHVKGKLNAVADLLSFCGSSDRSKTHPLAGDYPPNTVLTQRFRSALPNQIPATFEIVQLPSEILSWVSLMLSIAESYLTVVKKEGTKAPTESGGAGADSVSPLGPARIRSSLCYPSSNANFSSEPFCKDTALLTGLRVGNLQAIVNDLWGAALSAKPQATWVRRFGCISGTAPCTSREARTCDRPSDLC